MARVFTRETLAKEFDRARARGWERHCRDAERALGHPRGLMLAVASQETDMNDVVGDRGHGRGLFQIDDRFHRDFLARHAAAGPNGKPPVGPAARYAAQIVKDGREHGRRNGVRERDLLKFSLSAYNAGARGALDGYVLGDSDRKTTGGNYGRVVLERLAHFQALLGEAPPPLLRRGSRNRHVTELKEELAAWYARNAPGEWERFGVTPGPRFGARLERAVSDFQGRVGLRVDGVAGPDTVGALRR